MTINISDVNNNIEIIIFSDNINNGLRRLEYNDFISEYKLNIALKRTNNKYHDRYIIIDYKSENEIEILVDAEDKFYLCIYDLDFIKINNNYFFLYYYIDMPNTASAIYTKDWKKIGYISRNSIKYDNEGIYFYTNDELNGKESKYNFNVNS